MDPEKYFDEASTLVSEEYQKNDCDLRALPPEFVIFSQSSHRLGSMTPGP